MSVNRCLFQLKSNTTGYFMQWLLNSQEPCHWTKTEILSRFMTII